MTTIAVIDYGMGNLRSVSKAVEHVANGATIHVTSDPKIILRSSHVIFPGVGAIRGCMDELHRLELADVIRECAQLKPFLGICLGMQALLEFNEENEGTEGLGIIPGEVRYFGEQLLDDKSGERLKIPHMGWNQVYQRTPHALWEDIPDDSRFYFVHGYYAKPKDDACIAGETHYGLDFAAAIVHKNIFATQFHPEKSQRAGLTLLANFVRWDGA